MGVGNLTLDNTILKDNGAKRREGGIAGVVIDAGQALYLNTSTGRYELAQGDTQAKSQFAGVAEHPAGIGQPISLIAEGDVTGLTGLTAGESYVLSDDSAGDIMPISNLATNHWVTHVLIATGTTTARIKPNIGDVQHA